MKVMVLLSDRYGMRALQKDVVEVKGENLTKITVSLAFKASKFCEKDMNDEGEELTSKEWKNYIPSIGKYASTIISKDRSTAHNSGEEQDYIFIVM